ncbi:uncharacterized protein TrAFT101_009971 [Trichoderma asperellum]|uniref:Uncharacterized protein n=1 Tax=Trichoderma asperellum (strain ATCC 204424 / CBS 433.97 / NBRC 101777) TaxID=1042311 RepID=A0A2T3Z9H2_TRIA4|nr:hypothetical protein M441DRAFT_46588 [Trichoderma asperellum CBS 433.97]PTB41422.1 hypothetical protein M441DRAFT_46588 [Trichoderma asperellum CBS 433.97]UKZ95118.1 hypothetical protein TrAFT101_009971 [Trichoderma asperellum]
MAGTAPLGVLPTPSACSAANTLGAKPAGQWWTRCPVNLPAAHETLGIKHRKPSTRNNAALECYKLLSKILHFHCSQRLPAYDSASVVARIKFWVYECEYAYLDAHTCEIRGI